MPRIPVPPRNAAGLLLIRRGRAGPEVLLGRRRRTARAFPGAYVFPGGLVEPMDRRSSGFEEALPLPGGGVDRRTRRDLRVFARAALRECYEETGLLLASGTGRPAPAAASGGPAVWRSYAACGAAPAFGALLLIARAITPVGYPLRFHSRFFMALLEAEVQARPAGGRSGLNGDGELEDLGWVPIGETAGLPIADANIVVLREAEARLAARGGGPAGWPGAAAREPAPCYTWRGAAEHEVRTVNLPGGA